METKNKKSTEKTFKCAETPAFYFWISENSEDIIMSRKSDGHIIEDTRICVRELHGAIKADAITLVSPDYLHEYIELCDDLGVEPNDKVVDDADLQRAKAEAKKISMEQGVVQHVNKSSDGCYSVSDWYDCDSTVASYNNGDY